MAATIADDFNVSLDFLSQQPGIQIYTQICFCFPVADPSAHPSIVETLTNGLERLAISFPWVAGQVVSEGAEEGNTGRFSIKALDKIPRLVVKDLRDDPSAPTLEELRQAEYPISMLNEDIIAPRRTLPGGPGYVPTDPNPVLLLQANFIVGGILITVNGQHAAMDMTGLAELIRLLSKACRNESFTPEELSVGNFDRTNIVPLLEDSYQPGSELDDFMVKPSPSAPDSSSPPSPPPSRWANFSFSASSLAELKASALENLDPSVEFISTDDVLNAFIWQSVNRARLPRLGAASSSKFVRAVNARPYFDVPTTYPGMLVCMAYSSSTVGELQALPLGRAASRLRLGLDPGKLRYQMQAVATLFDRNQDKTVFSPSAAVNATSDCLLSSWAKIKAYDHDFGLGLGKPESVRRPGFTPVESLMYLLPMSPDGTITGALCLRDDDLQRLKNHEEFARFGKYIG
ncbi:hypothetical protein G7046_g4979 [Stylonectria norvegica]|nr:hypothetical protein G7046_g4979 [Stylonectria norvegica]